MKTFIGVDPGANGAIVRIAIRDYGKPIVETFAMPKTEKDIATLFKDLAAAEEIFGSIEKVNAFPGQGVVSVWKFSASYHGLRMAMVCAGISFIEVPPRTWQKRLGIPARKRETETHVQHKNKLKAMAQQLFPSEKVTLANADALLIAEDLRRIY